MLLPRDPALTVGQEEGITETGPRLLERGSVLQFHLLRGNEFNAARTTES